MYGDTITLFNRYEDSMGTITWYPTVIRGVNLAIDKAAIVAKYGAESKDNAILNVKCSIVGGEKFVDGKQWLSPKDWENQTNDMLPQTITFASGNNFDFFCFGEWSEDPIMDEDYRNGFYDYMNQNYDFVFSITSVSILSVIPHFEIVGR